MKKKILFLIECMSVGGAEKILINLANGLDKNKYDVTVMKVYKENIYNQNATLGKRFDEDITVKYMCNNNNSFLYRLFNIALNRINTKLIHKLFIGSKYDVEIAYYEGLPTKIIANSSNKASKKIAWLHTDTRNRVINFNKEQFKKEKEYYLKYNTITAVSKDVSKSFEEIFNIRDRVIIKYNPIDINEIVAKASENIELQREEVLTFITIGRIIPVKAYERIINSLGKLKKEGFNFRLWMVGDGESRDKIEKLVLENNIKEEVKFLGFQSNPYKYLSKADVYVCSSIVEGYSTVAIEAIVCSKPVITTQCPGMKEIFNNKQCGIICENNEEELYKALKNVLQNKQSLSLYKAQCIERAKAFDVKVAVTDIEKIL